MKQVQFTVTVKVPYAVVVLLVWLLTLGLGMAGAELYARHAQNYLLWSWSLEKSLFFELDVLKVWNRRFDEQWPNYFRGWRIPLQFFEADKPFPRYLFKPNLRMALHRGKLVPAAAGEPVQWSSNSWGFRGEEFSASKPPGVIRLVTLGASTTEGSQSDHETYPYFLQQELRRMFPGRQIEVINAGHHGEGSDDLLEILRRRVFPIRPDVLIWYEGANDANPREFVRGLNCHIGWPSGNCWLYSYPVWHRRLYNRSALFVTLSDRFGWNNRRLSPFPHEFDDTSPKSSVDHYKAMLRQMARETLSRKIRFVLSSFMTYTGPELDPNDERFKPWYPVTPDELARLYRYVNGQSADVAREFHVPYVDVATRFPKERTYFPFDIYHFSPEGNRVLAHLFADVISRAVLPGILGDQTQARTQ